jgi:hypothetical protein
MLSNLYNCKSYKHLCLDKSFIKFSDPQTGKEQLFLQRAVHHTLYVNITV